VRVLLARPPTPRPGAADVTHAYSAVRPLPSDGAIPKRIMAWLAGPVEHRWHSLYLSVLEVSTVEADDLSVSDLETAEPLVRSAFGTTFRACATEPTVTCIPK
jgi:hypothetical protein